MFKQEGNIINSNTIIEFTIGKFIALLSSIIGALLSIFIGFYFVVFQPTVLKQIEDLKEYNAKLQEINMKLLKSELKPFLDDVSSNQQKIKALDDKVNGISDRFNDLNAVSHQYNNSGGLSSN